MKKIIVGLAGLVIILLPSEIAFAFGRGGSYSGSRGNVSSSNRYGGSTSHSYGSTSHSRVNTEKGRLTRTPMAGPRPAPMGKARLIRTLTAGPLQLNTGRARLIPMFTAVPPPAHTARAHTTPVPTDMVPPTIHRPPTMAIIRLPRSITTDQHAPTATVGRLRPLSQPPLLLVRLSLRQMQTLPMLMPRQPTLTTLDTTPARPQPRRVNLPRPRQPWLRPPATIPWDRW